MPDEDIARLLRHAGEAVLVGGQALAFWISYYRAPMRDAPGPVVTRDAGFLGDRDDAARLAKAIGGTVEYPRHMSILAGVVKKRLGAGAGYEVDVLRTLNGLAAEAVRKRAKTVTDESRGATYKVMAPVDCLVSRLENIRTIAAKRTDMDLWQARMAVHVARSQMEDLLAQDEEKQAIRAATQVFQAGTHPMGLHAFRRHAIDVLDAVPVGNFTSGDFVEQQCARSISRIRMLRAL